MTDELLALVCDDHAILRSGVVRILNQTDGIRVVGEAVDVESAIAKLRLYKPDILVCDLSLPGGSGFDVLASIAKEGMNVRSIILSMHTDLQYVQKAKELGASAYLAKEDSETELQNALWKDKNVFYTSESIGRATIGKKPDLSAYPEMDVLKVVSPAERRILALLARSLTNKEIASKLNISPKTVEAHRFRLAEKLDAKGPNKLLEWAITHRHLF